MNFAMNYQFNFQHHARFRAGTTASPIISLYDDGSDDSPPALGTTKPGYEAYSSGIVALVNTTTNASTIVERYVSPGYQLSESQGNLQYLPNNNRFMGMGNVPYMVEFTNNATGDGQVVYYASMSIGESYRMFKFPWTAHPATPPSVFSYAHNCSAQTVVYASWNGATEVATWRVKTSYTANGGFRRALQAHKTGFETQIIVPRYEHYVMVEALDVNGTVLGKSNSTSTFVPAASIAATCSALACATGTNYTRANTRANTTACANKVRSMQMLRE